MKLMQRSKAPIWYKRLLRKIDREGIISRKEFFKAIDSKHQNYIPTYFQGRIIPSITHNHGYFISKKYLKKHADKWGFYTTRSGINFHLEGNIDSVLKYLIRRKREGITVEEAKALCHRDCKRAFAKVLDNDNYLSEEILGTTVYLYRRRKDTQVKIRLTNCKVEAFFADEDGELLIPLEEVSTTLKQLVDSKEKHCKLMVSFLGKHLSSSWRNLSGQIKYNERYRDIIGKQGTCDIHFTTLNKYFRDISINDLKDLFKTMVKGLMNDGVIRGKYMAIDATHVFAWVNQNNTMYRTPYTGPDSYTDESVLQFAQHGFHQGRFFGYKCHLIVDCESELPVAMAVTSGNASDMSQIIPLVESIDDIVLKDVERLLGDAGYDYSDEIKKVNTIIKGMMIVDTNPRRNNVLKYMKKMIRGIFDKFSHKIENIDDAMRYIPQKLLTRFGVNVGNEKESSMVKMIQYHLNTGLRVAVERVFSRLKGMLPFEKPKLQKDTSVVKHVYLCVNWMLLVAYTANRLGYNENIRRLASVV